MSFEYFNQVLFIKDGDEDPIDTKANPYIYNDGGRAVPKPAPVGTLIQPQPDDLSVLLGHHYHGIRYKEEPYGTDDTIIVFDFGVPEVTYDPIWATKDSVRGFGITLLAPGESIAFDFNDMVTCDYTYGAFAAYQSPYIANSHDLIPINATDLEYHAFSHFFCSLGPIPLVTTVARWFKQDARIWLADLWVRPGDILYVPPKYERDDYQDMHGNRNSARACWGSTDQPSLLTQTILGDEDVFSAKETRPHYHKEPHPTVHTSL